MRRRIIVRLSVDRRSLRGALAFVLLLGLTLSLSSETLTLTTTYPAPVGVYNQIISTGGTGANTLLARDGGRVGVGTPNPASRLSVAGGIQLGLDSSACTAAKEGTLRWRSGTLEACAAASWRAVGGGDSRFGGAYTGIGAWTESGCGVPNPQTSACSCPPGHTSYLTGFSYNVSTPYYWYHVCQK